MKPLLEPDGLAALDAALARRALLAFDFDGTLAPIVADPDHARVPAALVPRLARLTELAAVAVISGRAVADVAQRLQFEPDYLIGNHGAEDPALDPAETKRMADEVELLLSAFRRRLDDAMDRLRESGVEVEDKGHSMALHYRRAPDETRARRAIDTVLAGHDPRLSVYGGKKVVNIVVAAAPDKGKALLALVARGRYDTAVFAGDDVNDESVFERALPGWVTVRIGTDPDSRAQWCLESIDQMPALIDRMIAAMTGRGDAR